MRAVCDKQERPPLDQSQAASFVGGLAQRCWTQEPDARPSFAEVEKECSVRLLGVAAPAPARSVRSVRV